MQGCLLIGGLLLLPWRKDLAISFELMKRKGKGTILKGDLYDWVVK